MDVVSGGSRFVVGMATAVCAVFLGLWPPVALYCPPLSEYLGRFNVKSQYWPPLSAYLRFGRLNARAAWESGGDFAHPFGRNFYVVPEEFLSYGIITYVLSETRFDSKQSRSILQDVVYQARADYGETWRTGKLMKRTKRRYEAFKPTWMCIMILDDASGERASAVYVVRAEQVFAERLQFKTMVDQSWSMTAKEIARLRIDDGEHPEWVRCVRRIVGMHMDKMQKQEKDVRQDK